MTPTRIPLHDLPKGQTISPTEFQISNETLSAYLSALDDQNDCYRDSGFSPPLAVTAFALGSLLEQIELPPGSLHTSQEVDVHCGIPAGSSLDLSGRLAHRSERAGFVISVLEFNVSFVESGQLALTGRTTVMTPADLQ